MSKPKVMTKLVEMSKKLSNSTDDLLDDLLSTVNETKSEPTTIEQVIKPSPKKSEYDASLFIKVLRLDLFGDNSTLKAEKTLKVNLPLRKIVILL